jgi:hypothetical protein
MSNVGFARARNSPQSNPSFVGAILLSANRYLAPSCVAPSSKSISPPRRITISELPIRPPVGADSAARDRRMPPRSTNTALRTRICSALAPASNPIYLRAVSAGPHVSIHTTEGMLASMNATSAARCTTCFSLNTTGDHAGERRQANRAIAVVDRAITIAEADQIGHPVATAQTAQIPDMRSFTWTPRSLLTDSSTTPQPDAVSPHSPP